MAEAPAGFWKRYAAWSLDAAILALPVWWLSAERLRHQARELLVAVVGLSDRLAEGMVDMLMRGGTPQALAHRLASDADVRAAIDGVALHAIGLVAAPAAWFAALAAVYWIGFEGSRWRATPGKRALGLRTADLSGERLSWGRTVLRHFAGTLSWLTLNIGHALAGWTARKQALHDLLAGAGVNAEAAGPMPGWARVWLVLQALVALTGCLWLYLVLLEAMQASVDNLLH